MSKLVVSITALLSLLAALSSTADAVTWHNTGSTAFTATGGPVTFTVMSNNLTCIGSTTTGAAPSGPVVTSTYTLPVTTNYTSCSFGTHFHCVSALTGTTWTAGPPAVTSGVEDITCGWRSDTSDVELCHVSGTRPWSYTNPNGAVAGRLTVPGGSVLSVTSPTGGACGFLGATSITFTEHGRIISGGAPTSLGPVLTRTP